MGPTIFRLIDHEYASVIQYLPQLRMSYLLSCHFTVDLCLGKHFNDLLKLPKR